jgi:hypothetical protein
MGDLKGLCGRIVVCAPASLPGIFDDDCFGACAVCGARVRYRPHVPAHRSLVCLLCFFVNADPGDACVITAESLDELESLTHAARNGES